MVDLIVRLTGSPLYSLGMIIIKLIKCITDFKLETLVPMIHYVPQKPELKARYEILIAHPV